MINKVILVGNLGRDPEIRRLESGVAVAKFPMATNESYKDKNGEWQNLTEWHDVVAWRGLAERVERDCKKGKLVYVEGKLTHRKYQDKEGNDRYITEIVANVLRVLEKREGGGGFNSSFPSAADAPPTVTTNMGATTNDSSTSATTVTEKVADAPDDDLPF